MPDAQPSAAEALGGLALIGLGLVLLAMGFFGALGYGISESDDLGLLLRWLLICGVPGLTLFLFGVTVLRSSIKRN